MEHSILVASMSHGKAASLSLCKSSLSSIAVIKITLPMANIDCNFGEIYICFLKERNKDGRNERTKEIKREGV
jgi:hypothetical protein